MRSEDRDQLRRALQGFPFTAETKIMIENIVDAVTGQFTDDQMDAMTKEMKNLFAPDVLKEIEKRAQGKNPFEA